MESFYEFALYAALSWQFWVIIGFLVIASIVIITLLWKNRENKILKGIQNVINAASDGEDMTYTVPRDLQDALESLLEKRKVEMNRLNLMETYRRDYIGNVAHELKTPLFSIQGYIESVLDDTELDSATREIFLLKANKNVRRLAQIVSDLDTITKYESGFLRLEYETFDIKELLHEVIESLEMQARENNITISDYSENVLAPVYADKNRIRQVFTNLGFNSIKYGKSGGYTKFKLKDVGDKIYIEVADNGIGIPKEDVKRIFERFYRVERSRSRDAGGSGLGLSICKHVIEAHGEQISVLSTIGAGSVFSFHLSKA